MDARPDALRTGASRAVGHAGHRFSGMLVAMAAEPALLDAINRDLLAALQADGRLSLAELGRRVGLSPSAVAERLARLEQAGVITGYHAAIDPRALGFTVAAVVRVRPAPRQLHRIPERRRGDPRGRRVLPDHRRGLLPDRACSCARWTSSRGSSTASRRSGRPRRRSCTRRRCRRARCRWTADGPSCGRGRPRAGRAPAAQGRPCRGLRARDRVRLASAVAVALRPGSRRPLRPARSSDLDRSVCLCNA